MLSTLAGVLALYLVTVAGLAVLAALGAPLTTAVRTGVVVAEILLVLLAVLDTAAVLGGERPSEPWVHLGYAVTAVVLLPLLLLRPRRDPDNGRPEHAVAALACVAAAVVVWRLRSTA